jgi:hypothetical protein
VQLDHSVAQAFAEVLQNHYMPAHLSVIVQFLPQSKWLASGKDVQRVENVEASGLQVQLHTQEEEEAD